MAFNCAHSQAPPLRTLAEIGKAKAGGRSLVATVVRWSLFSSFADEFLFLLRFLLPFFLKKSVDLFYASEGRGLEMKDSGSRSSLLALGSPPRVGRLINYGDAGGLKERRKEAELIDPG